MTYAHTNRAAQTPGSETDTAATRNSVEAKQKQDRRCNLLGVRRQVALHLQVLIPEDSGEKGLRKHHACRTVLWEALCLVCTQLMCQRGVTTAQGNDSLSLDQVELAPRPMQDHNTASFRPSLWILVVQKDTVFSPALPQKYSRSRCHSSCWMIFVKLKGMFRKRIGWEKWYLIAVHRCAIPGGKQEMRFSSCICNRVLEAPGRGTSSRLSGMGEGVGVCLNYFH